LSQKQIAAIEQDKRETERNKMRLEKDKCALKKTLDRVEREKMQHEEMSKIIDKSGLERQLQRLEEENCCMQRQIQELQGQLAEAEQIHAQRLIDITTRNRKETEMETERLRSSQIQSERQLESREKSHRQRIKSLEEQIATLRDQLSREIRTRQNFLNHSVNADDEIKNLHSILSESLHTVSRDPILDPVLLDIETRRLNESMGSYIHEAPVRHRSPNRRCISPAKLKLMPRY
jgi:rootletin